ncbi:MAG TPA: PTS mannitol transporter subunit IICB [Cellulomonas sp.]
MSDYTPTVTGTGVKATVQKFGGYLAGMVMPNIGAFIAWGLITALFIETGWIPVGALGGFGVDADGVAYTGLVGPMITYLLPLLIAFTGGKMVHGHRGGVVGAIATVGVIVGAGTPMFLGAMIMGPAAAWIQKKIDGVLQPRTPAGFEMLVDNFSAGIAGAALAVGGFFGIGPVVGGLMSWAESGVGWLVDHSLLPLASLIIEPGKVLFLNNAINHGVLTPLGTAQSQETGRSVLFMLESNPGPGLGLLLAFMFFGPRALRASTPGAIVIHFFGGIHEIYFPYVLMKPKLIAATILGAASGILTFVVTGAGLVASPSPGSIFAYFAMTPRGGILPMLSGVVVATAVSFAVASLLLGFGRGEKPDPEPETGTPAEADRPAAVGSTTTDAPQRVPAGTTSRSDAAPAGSADAAGGLA